MYNTTYYPAYNQPMDMINNQMQELERMKAQLQQRQQPTNLTQNFQISPNNNATIKYVNSVDDVKKELVIAETPFFSKDLSTLWLKNAKGEIRSYELKEIIEKDEKDLIIENLQKQINELKGKIENEPNINVNESIKDEEPSSISVPRTSTKKQK